MAQRTPRPANQSPAKAFTAYNLVGWTIGAKASNTINVAMQLKDALGNNVAQVVSVNMYLSDNTNGASVTATATTSPLAVGTNGALQGILTTGKVASFISDASGRVDINVIQTGSPVTYYMVAELPDGSIAVSPAIVF